MFAHAHPTCIVGIAFKFRINPCTIMCEVGIFPFKGVIRTILIGRNRPCILIMRHEDVIVVVVIEDQVLRHDFRQVRNEEFTTIRTRFYDFQLRRIRFINILRPENCRISELVQTNT